MFNYYGSKQRIIKYYPKPIYDSIIEPFAGSARYSLKYWNRNITLIEKSEFIFNLWMYLINASIDDLNNIPIFEIGEDIRDYNFNKEELYFIRFQISIAPHSPGWKVSPLCTKYYQNKRIYTIKNNLHKIKNWKIILGDYREIENKKSTWFIDPPYQYGGHKYMENNSKLNYKELSNWCKKRKGQIIICENSKANWMKFIPLIKHKSNQNIFTEECMWTNKPSSINIIQQTLF